PLERIARIRVDALDGLLETNHPKTSLTQVLDDREQNLHALIVGRKTFLREEVAKLGHIVCANAEDVERLQCGDMFRALERIEQSRFRTPFQAHVVALKTDASPEKLNDLRTFALADVHQAHGAHTPTAPAFSELLGADKNVDRGFWVV